MSLPPLLKYPRTRHIIGSRRQPGDEDLTDEPFAAISGRHLVIEEKIDGANAAISFDPQGQLLLQSRGHYLSGGSREKHFALLKTWAATHCRQLRGLLGSRYVVYGEWVLAKHTIFYDALPHYFLEFDVFDREQQSFLSTERRRKLLSHSPLVSVPVVREGSFRDETLLRQLIVDSLYKSSQWRENLLQAAAQAGINSDRAQRETDLSGLSEGLYIKIEEEGQVLARYKFVRESFLTSVVDSGSHWLSRPIVRNLLAPGVDIFGEES